MTGTRVDTGQGWTQDVPLWSMLGKSQLQVDKECAPGNRGATQGKEQPLPCPEPLSRVVAGAGGFLSPLFPLHLGAAEQLQSTPLVLAQSFGQLQGEAKALGRGKAASGGGTSKSPAELGRGNPPWAQSACPPPALTRQDVCQLGQLLPQFSSWYDPPRSASAAGAQGLSKQLSSNESFHPSFLSFDQVHRVRGRDPPDLPLSLPPYPQAQPTARCSLRVLPAPLLVEGSIHHYTQPMWEPVLEKQSGISQGTSRPGKFSVSSSHCACPDARGRAGCGILQRGVCRHGQGLGGTLHTLGAQGAPRQAVLTSLPPRTKQSTPSGSRLCQVCPMHTTQRLAQPIHSWTAPSVSSHPAQGSQGALGRARSREPSTHPSCLSLAALQPGAESNISCAG